MAGHTFTLESFPACPVIDVTQKERGQEAINLSLTEKEEKYRPSYYIQFLHHKTWR